MNKRQKAKHYKMLYESLLAKGGPPIKVQTTRLPVETYRAVTTVESSIEPDIRRHIAQSALINEFEKIFRNNMIIEEVPPEDNYLGSDKKIYGATVRISWI